MPRSNRSPLSLNSIMRTLRRNRRRAFIVISGVSALSIALASGGALTSKRIMLVALAQSDPLKSSRNQAQLTAPQQSDQNVQLSAQTIDQIVALEMEKSNRTPAEQKIDSQLLQALRESRGQKMASAANLAPANVGSDSDGNVKVDIAADVTDDLIIRIESLGGQIIFPSWQYHTIRAQVSLANVETIAAYPEVTFIQPAVGSVLDR